MARRKPVPTSRVYYGSGSFSRAASPVRASDSRPRVGVTGAGRDVRASVRNPERGNRYQLLFSVDATFTRPEAEDVAAAEWLNKPGLRNRGDYQKLFRPYLERAERRAITSGRRVRRRAPQ